jgi:tetratricopeptide (TPR) repeat protein
MKSTVIIILLCVCVSVARAQDVDAILNTADSLNIPPEVALEIVNRALADNPDSEELLKVRADAYESLNQYDRAVADYMRLTQIEPDEELFWYLLGRNQYKNGQLQDAMKSLNRAISLNRKYLPAFHTKIEILLELDQVEAALAVSDSTLNMIETAKTYFLLGEVYRRMKSWQKAEWAYQEATKTDRGYIDAYIALADITANTNKARETLEAAEAALGINPDSYEALIARSRGFALLKNYPYAIDDVSDAIKLAPNNVNAYYWRGTYYRDTNKPQEAIKDFDTVLKFQPDNWQAIAGRADAFAKTGDKNTALEGYRKLLNIAVSHPDKETITQLANRQIFELNREDRAPTLALIEPIPEDFNIQVPDDRPSITIKGKITDESPIRSLTVNGQNVPVTPVGSDYEFATVVNLENVQEIQMEASDVYENTTNVAYRLVRTETGKPQIELITPKPSETGLITLANNDATLYIEGRVTDESAIASITVDGKAVDFDQETANPAFSAIVDVNNKTRIIITATDRFGNTTEQTYTLEKVTAITAGSPANDPEDVPAVEQASH